MTSNRCFASCLTRSSRAKSVLSDALYQTYFLLCELARGGVDGVFGSVAVAGTGWIARQMSAITCHSASPQQQRQPVGYRTLDSQMGRNERLRHYRTNPRMIRTP
jgi:hypothetical protein